VKPGERSIKLVESPKVGDTSCAAFGAYHNVLLPLPPVSPGVIIVMIPQFCGTGPFGSDIKITIASKINVKFLKSATAELEKKIENLPIEARDCKSRAAV